MESMQTTTSAATMQSKNLCTRDGASGFSLPEEVILEVLIRLPANALCRFRCVSKAWRAFISGSAPFVAAQRSHAGSIIVAMFTSSTKTKQHQLRLLDGRSNVLRVFDIRGVTRLAPMLASTRLGLVFVDSRRQHGAMIIDPASGHTCTVDGNNYRTPPTDFSFGCAVPSGEYKVLRLDNSCCAVATVSGSGEAEPTWRQRPWGPIRFCPAFPCQRECKATVNGVLYFMPFVTSSAIDDTRIAAFNLESEEWEVEMINGPALGRKETAEQWSIALAELKGTLCMVHNVGNTTSLAGHYANIWLLTDHARGIWVKEYTIRTPERYLLSTKPLDVLGDGTTLLLLNEFWRTGNIERYDRYILQLYNSSTKTFTDYMAMPEGFNGRLAFYTGSLLS